MYTQEYHDLINELIAKREFDLADRVSKLYAQAYDKGFDTMKTIATETIKGFKW